MRWLLLVFAVACSKGSAPAPTQGSAATAPSANVAPTLPIDAPRGAPPKVDTTCKETSDCTLTSDAFEDDAPRTYACCPGCSETAVSRQSYEAFQTWCGANRPPMCPPLGCLMPEMRALCEAGHCVAKDARTVTKPDIPPTP